MLEMWGGAECTMARVGGAYCDQLDLTGHDRRAGDIEVLASLGLDAFRTAVLWEKAAPGPDGSIDWSQPDRRLAGLQRIGLRPIVGLIHHGGGPAYTSLIEDGFAQGLAAHAEAVARRYPWVADWTPVNEPLTTARFSALYGHWYPHKRSEAAFWLALLNQVDAIRLSMRTIRAEIPGARLIQTEDLGRTYSTAIVRDQAAFDNQRRWMTWDLLCGHVTPQHPFWTRLKDFGLGDRVRAIADDPCPPDIIGINHYLTSDRFLDHRLRRYPDALAGGSATRRFADIEAVRVLDPAPDGLTLAVTEAFARYKLPIAITEVHNGSTRDEQLRWLTEAWDTAGALRERGVDIRAVTAWSIFGSQGWNTLLTRPGRYEPGAFDVSSGLPRATALAGHVRALRHGPLARETDAIARAPGWWRSASRHAAPVQPRPARMAEHLRMKPVAFSSAQRPILIIGRHGTLARALALACAWRGLPCVALARGEIDVTDAASIEAALARHRPWVVINASGWVRVDDAEDEPEACMAANATGAGLVAEICTAHDLASAYFSSDLVFDGLSHTAYTEADAPNPINVYGRSKTRGEAAILATGGRHLVARTAAFFWEGSAHSFAMDVLHRLRAGETVTTCGVIVSPTYVPHLADAVLDLLIDGADGVWHLTNGEALGWDMFARRVCLACGADPGRIETVDPTRMAWRAPRPRFSGLGTKRGAALPSLDEAIAAFAARAAGGRLNGAQASA